MKTFAIFLSSTFVDLRKHRKAVAEALQRLGLQVVWMERFGARPDEPMTACLCEVEGCDLFVGLYAHRYGFTRPGGERSITEEEFEHARLNNKPAFCFFVEDNYPWPPNLIDPEPDRSKLAAFRRRVNTQVVRDVFTTPEDLAAKAIAAVGLYIKNRAYPPDGETVTVELVTDATAPSVLAALYLFTRRIPERERFQPEDIVRWLREDLENRQANGSVLRDYFLIARTQARVCGFTLMHFYPQHQLAFIAYRSCTCRSPGTVVRKFPCCSCMLQSRKQCHCHAPKLKSCCNLFIWNFTRRASPTLKHCWVDAAVRLGKSNI